MSGSVHHLPVAPKSPRWIARIEYRSLSGIVDVETAIEEIEELHDLVERGPDWNTISRIVIRLNPARVNYPNDTIEAAKER